MISKNSSDNEIITSVLSGNDLNYRFIIDRYRNKAFSLLCRITKNSSDAEEILQDCFIKTYNSLGQFRNESKFSTWFYRIVYNAGLSFIRKNTLEIFSSLEDSNDAVRSLDTDTFGIDSKDLKVIINNVLQKLPEKYSVIITMFYINDMSHEEINVLTGDSIPNIKVKLFRARVLLKELIIKNNLLKELQ